jgi:predicted transcriptional regulator
MVQAMTKLLERAIAKVREFPDEVQDSFAAALLGMAGEDVPLVRLDDETRAAISEGLAQAERGEFVPDEVVAEADKRHGVSRYAIRGVRSPIARRFSSISTN